MPRADRPPEIRVKTLKVIRGAGYVMLIAMARLLRRRKHILRLPIFVLIVLQGCASVTLVPPREWVVLKTSNATRYYPVRGMTTTAIFDEIDKNGLCDDRGCRATGQTSAEWKMNWEGIEVRSGLCGQDSMTITLDIVVPCNVLRA